MVLTPFQQNWCVRIIKRIIKSPISYPFRTVDSFLPPNCARNIYEIIKNPIDLNMILQNVIDKKYSRMVDWEHDVNLIWENAKILYHEKSPQMAMALDLEEWFKKKTKNYPRSKDEQWLNKFEKARNKLKKLVDNTPEEVKKIKQLREEEKEKKEYEEHMKNRAAKRKAENQETQNDKRKMVHLFPPPDI